MTNDILKCTYNILAQPLAGPKKVKQDPQCKANILVISELM